MSLPNTKSTPTTPHFVHLRREAWLRCLVELFLLNTLKLTRRREWLPFQYSCLENSMDRGALRATVHRATKSGYN